MEEQPVNVPQGYVIMTQEVLCRKDLSITAKLVYARMSGFKEFYESAETTGAFFGKSAKTIQSAKQELERKGLIKCIKNTGRGKCYCVDRLLKNGESDYSKMGSQSEQKWGLYNKEDIKVNNITNKLVIGETPKAEVVSQNYGKEEINEVLDLWNKVIGYPLKDSKYNRYAVNNFLRAKDKGIEWVKNMLALLKEAQKDKYSGIHIANYVDLQRDYEKLLAWGSAKYQQRQEDSSIIGDIPF
jgi:hypothetical protein